VHRSWYSAESVFHQKSICDDLVANLYDLNDLHFDISPRGVDLDTGWPTFAWWVVFSCYVFISLRSIKCCGDGASNTHRRG